MAKLFRIAAWRTIALLAFMLSLTLLVGWMFDRTWQFACIVLAMYLGAYLYRFLRFEQWLRGRRYLPPPDVEGMWGEVIAIVDRLYRRKQFHKRRTARLLREFRSLTTALPDGAVLLNGVNEIVWLNRRAADWLKIQRKRDFGFRIENLLRHPTFIDYLQRVEKNVTAAALENTYDATSVIIPMPADATRWISVYLVVTHKVAQRLLIVRDVTHQIRLETVRKDFVANVSHELRSPLTVIGGYLDGMSDDVTDDVSRDVSGDVSNESSIDAHWREPIAEMHRQAERMRAIINDLLELSHLEQSHPLTGDDAVDVPGVLAMLRKESLALAQRPKTITLRLESDAGLRGVEEELHSVFNNLLTNAIKYTPSDGEIDIRWWTDDHGAHVSVRDTGIGIAGDHLPRLTERFYRVDAGRSRAIGGSGLGLAIVKHALQRHDAHLEIQSELGRGSTFTCHFPSTRIVAKIH